MAANKRLRGLIVIGVLEIGIGLFFIAKIWGNISIQSVGAESNFGSLQQFAIAGGILAFLGHGTLMQKSMAWFGNVVVMSIAILICIAKAFQALYPVFHPNILIGIIPFALFAICILWYMTRPHVMLQFK